jgi:bifunctional UDP-N-acetylglucosamine pyrophosphorylase/glucosamine-1-phosphate N-acetyltransferase
MNIARHAVILVAGASTRTRPLTVQRPKPLIPLLGRPLLAHILDELVGLVDRVTLVVGYRADQIVATFGPVYRGMAIRYAYQTTINGTAGALMAATPLDEPFVLLYGDNLVSRADIEGVRQMRYGVAGLRVSDPRSFGILELVDGQVQRIIEKPAYPPPDALANAGIYHFDSEVVPLLHQITPSPRGELELTDLIGLLAARHPVGCHVCTGHWIPVGTPWEALVAARFLLAQQAQHQLQPQIAPGATVDPQAELEGSVVIGEGARIEGQVRIVGPVWIGPRAEIRSGALVIASVIETGATIESEAMVGGSVIGPAAIVEAGATISHSWLDEGVQIGPQTVIEAAAFSDPQPTAVVNGLLSHADLVNRGAVVAAGLTIAPASRVAAGSVLM